MFAVGVFLLSISGLGLLLCAIDALFGFIERREDRR